MHAGEGMLSPSVARQLIAMVAGDGAAGGRRGRAGPAGGALPARTGGCAGDRPRRPNADIAGELHISLGTVKSHASQLLAKLGVENRVQVALLVQEAR